MNKTISKRNPILTAPRGCGASPKVGGVYIAVEPGLYGTPVWNFLLDPTQVLPDGFGLSDIGMQFRAQMNPDGSPSLDKQGNQVYDLWDMIGGSGYPNPADWIMEVSILGFHQLVSPHLQFNLISEKSYYYACHRRASIVDVVLYQEERAREVRQPTSTTPLCPFDIKQHFDGTLFPATCPGILFEDLIHGEVLHNRYVRRTMPSFQYEGYAQLTPDIEHQTAAFFRLPIGIMAEFIVYDDPNTNKAQLALEKLEELENSLQQVKFIPFDQQ